MGILNMIHFNYKLLLKELASLIASFQRLRGKDLQGLEPNRSKNTWTGCLNKNHVYVWMRMKYWYFPWKKKSEVLASSFLKQVALKQELWLVGLSEWWSHRVDPSAVKSCCGVKKNIEVVSTSNCFISHASARTCSNRYAYVYATLPLKTFKMHIYCTHMLRQWFTRTKTMLFLLWTCTHSFLFISISHA